MTHTSETDPAGDAALLRAIAAGDHAAFAALHDRYAPLARRVAYRLVGDRGLAEEVAQEVFLTVWRRAASFDPARGDARAWLLAATRHRAIDQLRRRGARGREVPLLPLSVGDGRDGCWAAVADRERAAALRRALRALPDVQREALVLTHVAGLTGAEVARRTGVPVGTVKGRLRLGLRRLRAHLDADLAAD